MRTREKATGEAPAASAGLNDSNVIKTSDATMDQKKENINPSPDFPVVGIGASAGGLAAFEAFFSGMPADKDPGMAFVLVQHLDPNHKSILTELIGRYTRMQVFEAEDGMRVRPNCAYIIPPNCDMAFLNGSLHLIEPAKPRGQRLPIDFFFRSLAQDLRERAICIVLSGTGSDGTLGLRMVKGEGGMAMAEAPASAEYDGMPSSAIATGLVDYVLAPAEMGAQLIAYTSHATGQSSQPLVLQATKNINAIKKVLIILRSQTGHDFSQYKPNTINRRIERRMAVHQIDTLDEYVKFLQQTPGETEALFRDMLIGVTNFFRDTEAFAALEAQVIPKLFENRSVGSSVRVWVAGCSTGEEAYSLAMLLQERIEGEKKSFSVQVFATDIDNQAIATARTGLYPASIAADITAERLARFFTLEPDGSAYRINKGIRDLLVFSEQNLIKDPPFSKLDLISCRNLLIYLDGDLQKKVIPLFHYALNPGGMLFLGTSESIGDYSDLFTTLDRKEKLYQRESDTKGSQRLSLGQFLPKMMPKNMAKVPRGRKSSTNQKLQEFVENEILQKVVTACILVNDHGDILYIHGRTGLYLEPKSGPTDGYNILNMTREGLRRELVTGLRKAVLTKDVVRYQGLLVKTNGHLTPTNLTIHPVSATIDIAADTNNYLIVLEEAATDGYETIKLTDAEVKNVESPLSDERFAALRQELRAKEEYLQTSNEELETSNEELKSSNEEMQSVNEELQSTNEELETSKEELQSVNEELATVNTEMQLKVQDLSRVNNDMNNLLAGTGIGTVFIDHGLRILRFTPSATTIINLISSDVGRPIGHTVTNLVSYDNLVADAGSVLDTLVCKEVEVQTTEGSWFKMSIKPYRTLDNIIEGVVFTFFDITKTKQAEEALLISETRYRRLFETAQDGILILDAETGKINNVNPYLIKMLGYSEAAFINKAIWEIGLFKDIAANKAMFLELQKKEYVRYKNLPLETANGRKIEVEFISNVYEVAGKKVIQCDIRDIGGRRMDDEDEKPQEEGDV